MKITLYDTIILLENLGYECIPLKGLREAFFKEAEEAARPPEKPQELPPPIPEETTYKTPGEAQKARKKGEMTVFDSKLGGYINVPS